MTNEIEVSEIVVPERFRKDLGDLTALKQSIERIGVLHPIGITKAKKLVYGERRLEAVKQLGWTQIPFTYVDLDPMKLRIAELEENLRRKDLAWVEEVKAKAELDRMLRSIYGEQKPGRPQKNSLESNKLWDQQKTAELLSESQPLVSQDIQLAEWLEKRPELADLPTKSMAKQRLATILSGSEPNPFEMEKGEEAFNFECSCGRRYRVDWHNQVVEETKG